MATDDAPMTREQKTAWYHVEAGKCGGCGGLLIPAGYRNSPYTLGAYCDCVPNPAKCKKCGKEVKVTGIQSGEPLYRHDPCGAVTEYEVTDPRMLE